MLPIYLFGQEALVFEQNNYRTPENPYYWKFRKPFADYWQQDVHYRIQAKLIDTARRIDGREQLTYWNNSPDTLKVLYFHLYQNAFQPGSYLHQLNEQGKLKNTFGPNEAQGLGTVVENLMVDGENTEIELYNTILRVKLNKTIPPGTSVDISMKFQTWFDQGSMRRRMKVFEHSGVQHFDGVHWYPRICVYDRKFGWTTDQHLGKEFYGDYGTWDVQLDFPVQYVVEATGNLVNRSEVMPEELRKKLDISNFKTPGTVTEIIKPDGSYKSWKYHAENVHDFAFTADPTYRIGEASWNGIQCIALAQEPNAHAWQPTAEYVAKIVQIYSEDIGMYAYPKMVAADARDGMEYPMITLNSGNWPGHQFVIAHEVGHNWFFGMLGNNETYRASMDEGFTQFLTAWSLKEVSGRKERPNALEERVVYLGYLRHAMEENSARLNIHSDHFNSAERHGGGYGQVYYKTASMLYNLEYVLGDQTFQAAMRHYFNKWKIAHPYWEDFRTAITEYTKRDLNWFFDQWIETTDRIDYKLEKPKRLHERKDSFCYKLEIERLGEMEMPIDLLVELSNGKKMSYLIPNGLQHKVVSGMQVLDPWIGWNMVAPEYETEQCFEAELKQLIIDSSGRLSDINWLNNQWKRRFEHKFSLFNRPSQNRFAYGLMYSPDLWYNSIDGVKAGLRVQGGYMGIRHVFDLSAWYNTGVFPGLDYNEEQSRQRQLFNYALKYHHRIGQMTDLEIDSRILDGLQLQVLGVKRRWGNQELKFSMRSLVRRRAADLNYTHAPELWQASKWNNSFNVAYARDYKYPTGNGHIALQLRNASLFSDYNYSWIKTEVINRNRLGHKLALNTRFFAGYISGNGAPESRIYLAGASPEEWMDQKWLRSRAWFPDGWAVYGNDFGNVQYGGGLNVRGNAAYRATEVNADGDTISVFAGRSGISASAELDYTALLPTKFRNGRKPLSLQSYLFGDAGLLGTAQGHSGLRFNAGLGFLAQLRAQGIAGTNPLRIRLDLPVFINRIAANNGDYLQFRWVIGINRAF